MNVFVQCPKTTSVGTWHFIITGLVVLPSRWLKKSRCVHLFHQTYLCVESYAPTVQSEPQVSPGINHFLLLGVFSRAPLAAAPAPLPLGVLAASNWYWWSESSSANRLLAWKQKVFTEMVTLAMFKLFVNTETSS